MPQGDVVIVATSSQGKKNILRLKCTLAWPLYPTSPLGARMTTSRFLQSVTSHITAVVAVGAVSLVLAWHYVF
jgi:hypothetical protein